MSDSTMPAENQDVPPVQGHTIGFLETASACDLLLQRLVPAGFPETNINLFHGAEGMERWEAMMKGSLWGEATEDVFHEGLEELHDGHFVVSVEVPDAIEGAKVADVATELGGHGFRHFGFLADTRLTP